MATRTIQTRTLQELASEAAVRYTAANPLSQARFERSTGFLPGADTRTINHYAPFPVTIVRGEGARLYDLDRHEYADFLNDYTAGLYGHSNPAIQAAIAEAANNGLTLGGPTPNQQEFAELICGRFPSVERVRFTNSGTESNLMVISIARAVTRRDGVLVFDGAYHGGPLSFTGPDRRLNLPFPWIVGEYNDVESARSLIKGHADGLACVLVEPMLGGGGCIPATREFLDALRNATQRSGVLLIFDEVQTSRLAPGGLQEALGVYADLTTLGKYLGGGASFGAFGGRADLMDRFDPRRPDHFSHAGTHNNNAVTMAAGLAGLRDVLNTFGRAPAHPARRCPARRPQRRRVAAGRPRPGDGPGLDHDGTLPARADPLPCRYRRHAAVRARPVPPRDAARRVLDRTPRLHDGVPRPRRTRTARRWSASSKRSWSGTGPPSTRRSSDPAAAAYFKSPSSAPAADLGADLRPFPRGGVTVALPPIQTTHQLTDLEAKCEQFQRCPGRGVAADAVAVAEVELRPVERLRRLGGDSPVREVHGSGDVLSGVGFGGTAIDHDHRLALGPAPRRRPRNRFRRPASSCSD